MTSTSSLAAMLRYRHAYRAWDGLCNDEWITMAVSGPVT